MLSEQTKRLPVYRFCEDAPIEKRFCGIVGTLRLRGKIFRPVSRGYRRELLVADAGGSTDHGTRIDLVGCAVATTDGQNHNLPHEFGQMPEAGHRLRDIPDCSTQIRLMQPGAPWAQDCTVIAHCRESVVFFRDASLHILVKGALLGSKLVRRNKGESHNYSPGRWLRFASLRWWRRT